VKNEIIFFRLDLAIAEFEVLSQRIAQRFTETKLWTQRSLKPKLIQTLRITSHWFYIEDIC